MRVTGGGSCTITASQSGDSNFAPATEVQQSFNILKAGQTITFSSLSNRAFGDLPFNLSATASSGLTVSFSSTTPAVCSVTGNTATIAGAGLCSITGSQAGNGNYNGAAPVPQSFNVSQASTTTSLSSSVNPSGLGQSVTFTAVVASTAGTPAGTVQFKDGSANLGSPQPLNSAGVATFSTNALTPGAHNITAVYSGDANFAASTAPADYLGASGTLSFAPGEVAKSVTVQVKGDTQNESDETFRLSLTNPQNAAISDGEGIATILNDDTTLVQFKASSYQINEAANNTPQGFGSLTIEVVRTGDSSEPATVSYATSDQSGGNECNQVTGQASQRCDYMFASRTLRFAAGETSRTIQIPIINDGYQEGPEVFSVRLLNPAGMTLGVTSQASILIEDDAADSVSNTAANNPYLSNLFFVRMNYLDYLGRDVDLLGFAGWTSVLNNCGPEKGFLGAPEGCDRAHVSYGFFGFEEFTDTGFLIHRLYEAGMNRLPRYSEFTLDMATLSGFGISDSVRQQNLAAYLLQLTGRQEFTSRFQDVFEPAQAALLLQRLEQTVGVTLPATATTSAGQPAQYGRNELIQKRASGEFTFGQTLKAFVEQQAVYDRYFPGAM